MSHDIIIDILPDGTVEVEVKGVKGKGCEALTKPLEDALGRVAKRGYKPEYRLQEMTPTATRQKIGG